VGEKFVNFCQNFIGTKFLFRTGTNELSFLVFEFLATVDGVDFPLNKVVVENFFFNKAFAIVESKKLFQLVFFISVRIEQGIGFEGFKNFFIVFLAIEFACSTGG